MTEPFSLKSKCTPSLDEDVRMMNANSPIGSHPPKNGHHHATGASSVNDTERTKLNARKMVLDKAMRRDSVYRIILEPRRPCDRFQL